MGSETSIAWIPIAFVAVIVLVTIGLGVWATRISHTASDFFVAGRSVSAFWNASAISGEYLSAASFMGVAGMVMRYGYDTLWYPVGYAAGYLFLLLFIAGPLRRFGAYTIADFAEGRFDSPTFRKIAVTFVLFIGFFYTMPQMKGAGITLATILGCPYWVGVVVVGSVIAFNVALGGMRGITFVQAFQYWMKMFAIAAPVFVLMALTGGYHRHLGAVQARPSEYPTYRAAGAYTFKGARAAPANVVAFPPHTEVGFRFGKDTVVRVIGPARKPREGEDPIPPGRLLTPLGEPRPISGLATPGFFYPAGTEVTARVAPVTQGGVPVTADNGAAVQTGARLELETDSKLFFPAGAPVPNSPSNAQWLRPFGTLTNKYGHALLYTFSLILAIICGTAGLPHILVRFYTNPDGRSAKQTTFWVMVLIGVFYMFPPVWGAMGRQLMPDLYANGLTDRVVIRLPEVLHNVWGEVLAGITSAGAFAAFMSTFSGLLVSMSGALAHDIYGQILHPGASAASRLRMFKVAAVVVGAGAILLGLVVETFDINMMVGWAFAIAAASYFPLLLMGSWWRRLTMPGAAAGMLSGGLCSLAAIVTSMLIDKKVLAVTPDPVVRTLMEQPAIWGVPLALLVMVVVSRLTAAHVPKDVTMKMLRLHAPEELGLSRDYIVEGKR
jgi:cation/acetate symporter